MPGRSNFGTLTSLDAWGRSPNVRSSSPSIVRRRSRGSLPRLHLKHIAALLKRHQARRSDNLSAHYRYAGTELEPEDHNVSRGIAYDGDRARLTRVSDALTGLRQLLRRLECRQMSVKQGSIDVTSQQIAVLRREIEQLERMLSRLSGKG